MAATSSRRLRTPNLSNAARQDADARLLRMVRQAGCILRCRPRNSGERRVGCGLDVAVDLRGVWAFEHALGEDDDGQVVGWVHQPGRAQPAVPAERAAVVDRLAEPPRPAVEE